MSTVFFKLNPVMNKEVQELMRLEGYTSKADFFRFLVKFFKYHRLEILEERKLKQNTDELKNILLALNKKGKLDNLPSLDEQLAV